MLAELRVIRYYLMNFEYLQPIIFVNCAKVAKFIKFQGTPKISDFTVLAVAPDPTMWISDAE